MRTSPAVAAVLYTLFVVYASMVPLAFEPMSLQDAWTNFEVVPFVDLGLYSRADWIANGVLFVPIAFLWSVALGSRASSFAARLFLATGVFLAISLVAAALEFAQVFFPQRTLSRNDIYAETVGAGIGALTFALFSPRIESTIRAVGRDLPTTLRSLAACYAFFYLAASLFPFDFLLTWDELQQRLTNRPPSWLFESCGGLARCGLSFAVEAVCVAPLAVFLWSGRRLERDYVALWLLAGATLGLILETIQLFTYSGQVSGASLAARALGMLFGGLAIHLLSATSTDSIERYARMLVWWGVLPYLGLLTITNHLLPLGASDSQSLPEKWQSVRFMPFYYHYYNTEAAALGKLFVQSIMYAPVGFACWALSRNKIPAAPWWLPGLAGALLAAVVWVARLAIGLGLPDPTNVLVAFAAAAVSYALLSKLWVTAVSPPGTKGPPDSAESRNYLPDVQPPLQVDNRIPAIHRVVGVIVLATAAALVAGHPTHAIGLAIGLACYAALLARFPLFWLVVVPATLPALDFTPQTGWIYLEEFDLVMLVTLGTCLSTQRVSSMRISGAGSGVLLLAMLFAVVVAGAVHGVWSSDLARARSLLGYDGPWNGLRLLKGYLWPVVMLPFLLTAARLDASRTIARFAAGTVVGVVASSLWYVWERYLFTGLWNFEETWRAAGGFSAMHVGGAASDNYLVIALPFIAWLFLARPMAWRVLLAPVAALAVYAILITFTRATYLALILSTIWLVVAGLSNWRAPRRLRYAVGAVCLTGLVAAAIAPALTEGSFFSSRWGNVARDAQVRLSHWRQLLRRDDSSWADVLVGHGLGRQTELAWAEMHNTERPGQALLRYDAEAAYLRTYGGRNTYIDQRVRVIPGSRIQLSIQARSAEGALFRYYFCEKHLLNSKLCQTGSIQVPPSRNWVTASTDVDATVLGLPREPIPLAPPVYFSFATPGSSQVMDVREITIRDALGRDLLENGDFEHGGERWFFTQDDHLLWRVKNLWVYLYIELGITGMAVFFLLFVYVGLRALEKQGRGSFEAAIFVSSMLAAAVVSITDSVLDVARITAYVMFVMLLAVATLHRLERRPAATNS